MKEQVEVCWFSEQPYGHVTDADLAQYASGRRGFPNTYFDPHKAHALYNQYHEQYALADEVDFDGIILCAPFWHSANAQGDMPCLCCR